MSEQNNGTADPSAALQVVRNDERSRYEGRIGDQLTTVVDFHRRGDVLVVTHTGTEPRWRGQGLAGRTTEQVLADVRASGWRVEPWCSFTAAYFDEHPEVRDLRA